MFFIMYFFNVVKVFIRNVCLCCFFVINRSGSIERVQISPSNTVVAPPVR